MRLDYDFSQKKEFDGIAGHDRNHPKTKAKE